MSCPPLCGNCGGLLVAVIGSSMVVCMLCGVKFDLVEKK